MLDRVKRWMRGPIAEPQPYMGGIDRSTSPYWGVGNANAAQAYAQQTVGTSNQAQTSNAQRAEAFGKAWDKANEAFAKDGLDALNLSGFKVGDQVHFTIADHGSIAQERKFVQALIATNPRELYYPNGLPEGVDPTTFELPAGYVWIIVATGTAELFKHYRVPAMLLKLTDP